MSRDGQDDDDQDGMGIVRRRRSRRIMETRDPTKAKGAATANDAASAWGDHLAASMQDGDGPADPPGSPARTPSTRAPVGSPRRSTGPIDPLRVAADRDRARRGLAPTASRAHPSAGLQASSASGRSQRAAEPTPAPATVNDEPTEPAEPAVERSMHLQAAQLANAAEEHARDDSFRSGAGALSWHRVRPFVAGAIVLAGLLIAVLPVMNDANRGSRRANLGRVLDSEAKRVAAANPAITQWVREPRVAELRALHNAEFPKVVAALRNGGFPEASDRTVTIRVDTRSNSLVLNATFGDDDDDRPVRASASTSAAAAGPEVGPTGFGGALDANLAQVIGALVASLVLAAALWLAPGLRRRREA